MRGTHASAQLCGDTQRGALETADCTLTVRGPARSASRHTGAACAGWLRAARRNGEASGRATCVLNTAAAGVRPHPSPLCADAAEYTRLLYE